MAVGKYYGYVRVVSETEKQSTLGQEKAIKKYCSEHHKDVVIYKDANRCKREFENRPEFELLISNVRIGDTIIFKDVSRLSSDPKLLFRKYNELSNKNVNMIFLDNPTMSTDYIEKLCRNAVAAYVVDKAVLDDLVELLLECELTRMDLEREAISEKIVSGRRESSNKGGRKKGRLDKMTEELHDQLVDYIKTRSIPLREISKKFHLSENTAKKYAKIVQSELDEKSIID